MSAHALLTLPCDDVHTLPPSIDSNSYATANCQALGGYGDAVKGQTILKNRGEGCMEEIDGVSDPWGQHPPKGSLAIREGRGGRRSQIFPLNERHDFHHCFCCPGNQEQPSGEYSKRTPCLSLLSDPLPCTPFPDHPLSPRPAPNFLQHDHHASGLCCCSIPQEQGSILSILSTICTMCSSTVPSWGSSHHTHLPSQGPLRANNWTQKTRTVSTLSDHPLDKGK